MLPERIPATSARVKLVFLLMPVNAAPEGPTPVNSELVTATPSTRSYARAGEPTDTRGSVVGLLRPANRLTSTSVTPKSGIWLLPKVGVYPNVGNPFWAAVQTVPCVPAVSRDAVPSTEAVVGKFSCWAAPAADWLPAWGMPPLGEVPPLNL